jgi:hypothetical protein
MATQERRKIMGLDDVYRYCRELEANQGRPILFKLAQSIRTLDYAIAASFNEQRDGPKVSNHAWSKVRDQLFTRLITSFEGMFLVYAEGQEQPLEAGGDWPETGYIEFYPTRLGRRNDLFQCRLERMDPVVSVCLRWSFADCRQHITPAHFVTDYTDSPSEESEREQASQLLEQLYNICQAEASQGKKNAHRKWWQLYWQADSCQSKSEKQELQKQMNHLQSMWGRPVSA